jgi:hypothetical protein
MTNCRYEYTKEGKYWYCAIKGKEKSIKDSFEKYTLDERRELK